ncbi:MAG: insulinase family protein [Anaerolineae bacterium]|nr:insulinase family protein [Anaerolineae bacterium]
MGTNGILKTRLKNGLTVLIKETHNAPVATFWVWYRVGSRNEIPGITGASHWVEHMQFKGTPTYPASALDKLISREGGAWNAFTFIDWTAYFEVMPADKIELGIDLEADRMANSAFDPEEVDSERTVIISERSGSENSPAWLLYEEMLGAAFRVHPYRTEVVGELIDLQTMTRDDLYNHYRRYYAPGNAVAVLVGDVDAGQALKDIEERFGEISGGEAIPEVVRPEPPQYGERRVTVNREGQTAYIMVAYRGYEIKHPDFFALAVADSILAGATSFNFMSTAETSNHTSRLYKALVETELAAGMSGGLTATIDPYLYTISATVRDGRTCREVEDAIHAETDRMAQGDISEQEFAKARKQAKALFAYDSESVSSQGFWLGFAETLVGDYEWFDTFLDKLMAVTLDDVKRVSADVFQSNKRIVGWYVPTGNGTQQGGE